MQGRLSPALMRVQEFPADWQAEFVRARQLGFDLIEWLVTASSVDRNPLLLDPDAVRQIVAASGVRSVSVCADYLIECPLTGVTQTDRDAAIDLLGRVVDGASAIGATVVSLPMLEGNAVTREQLAEVLMYLRDVIRAAGQKSVRIAIETDLPAFDIIETIERAGVAVCYDLGNAAAAGREIVAELQVLGDRVAVIHVKDRLKGGGSVRLGQGSVPFSTAFAALQSASPAVPVILETPRGDSPVETARGYLAFVKQHLQTAALA
jgi:sugar phosphate isomerase/epimerase